MKQVTKEDFEVLSKYHPTEIRYYADTGTEVSKRKPVRVTIKRPHSLKVNRKDKVKKGKRLHGRAASGQYVQLSTEGPGDMRPGTAIYKVYSTCTRLLSNDPTMTMKRSELTKALVKEMPGFSKVSIIVPSLSALITKGKLRYTGAAA